MASKGWVMPLAASFCLGIVVLSLLALLTIVVWGHTELVLRDGRRLALIVFVFFSIVWATFTFVDMFSTTEGFCQASAGISSFADQIARTSILGLMIWRFAKIVTFWQQNIWMAVICGRLVLAAVFVAFTRADLETTCVINSQSPALPGLLLGADMLLIAVILLRVFFSKVWVDWNEDAAGRMLLKCLLSVLSFITWEALSAPMILRKPQGVLAMRTLLPSIGYVLQVLFLGFFPSSVVHMKTNKAPDMEENKSQIVEVPARVHSLDSPRIGSPYTLPMRSREHPLRVVNPSKISSRHSSGRWDGHAGSIAGMLSSESIVSQEPPRPPAKEQSPLGKTAMTDVEARALFSTATIVAPMNEQTNPRIPEAKMQLSQMQEANSQRLDALRSTLSTLFPENKNPSARMNQDMTEVGKRMSTMGNPLRSNAVRRTLPPPKPAPAAPVPPSSFPMPPAAPPGRTVFSSTSTAVESTEADSTADINDAVMKFFSKTESGAGCRISTSETYKVQVGDRRLSIQRNSELFSPSAITKKTPQPATELPKSAESASKPVQVPVPATEEEPSLDVKVVDIDEMDPEEKAALTPKPLVPVKRNGSSATSSVKSRNSSLRSQRSTRERRISRKPVPPPQAPPAAPVLASVEPVRTEATASPAIRDSLIQSAKSSHRESTESMAMIAHATSVKRPVKKASVVELNGQPVRTRSQRSFRNKRSSLLSVAPLPSIRAESSAEPSPVVKRMLASPKNTKTPKSPKRLQWHYRVGDKIPTFSRRVARQAASPKAPPVPLRSAKRERATLQKKRERSPQTLVKEVTKSLEKYKEPAATPKRSTSLKRPERTASRLSYVSMKPEDRLIMIEAEDLDFNTGHEMPWIIFPQSGKSSDDPGTLSRRSSCALPSSLMNPGSVPEVPARTPDVKSVHNSPTEGGQAQYQITLALNSPTRLLNTGLRAPSTASTMQNPI